MEKGKDLLNVYLDGLKSGCFSVCFLGVFMVSFRLGLF